MRTITDPEQIGAELARYARDRAGILGLYAWREARSEDQRTRFCIARTLVNRCALSPARGFQATPAANILQTDCFDSFRLDNPASTHFPDDDDITWQQCVLAARSALGIIHGDPTFGSVFYHGPLHPGPATEWGAVERTISSGRFTFYRPA